METIKNLKSEIRKLERLVRTQSGEITRLSSLTDYDFLTGIYNRQGFIREAEKFFKEFKKTEQNERRAISFKNFSILFVDLDNLKVINDAYWHEAGDEAIKKAAEVFKGSLRDFDVVARWGGDEFILGLVGADGREALHVAQKLKSQLNAVKVRGFALGASFGVISAIHDGLKTKVLNLYELIEKADTAMYEAKKNKGKGFIVAH
ncbi:GGDEF domain-containing protein [Candidatus Azambacteria bacterium]|nr:GGDEF domain-containing protein [Candidatus Azambacteria bacterium]